MKATKPFSFLPLCLLLSASCSFPSEQIKDAFETVNTSISKSNEHLDAGIGRDYATLKQARTRDPALVAKADTIYILAAQTQTFIDSLKTVMEKEDSSRVNTSVAGRLLFHTKTSANLKKLLSQFYGSVKSYTSDETQHKKIDSVTSSIISVLQTEDWEKLYFEDQPTVAAITTLNSFQNQCKNAAQIAFEDMKAHMISPNGRQKIFRHTQFVDDKILKRTNDTLFVISKTIDLFSVRRLSNVLYHLPDTLVNKERKSQKRSVWASVNTKTYSPTNSQNVYTYDSIGRLIQFAYTSCLACSSLPYNYHITYNSIGQIDKISNTTGIREICIIFYNKDGDVVRLEEYSAGEITFTSELLN